MEKKQYKKVESIPEDTKVEPLQNGEREELRKLLVDEHTMDGVTMTFTKDVNIEAVEEWVASKLSQAKKEVFTKEEWDLILYGVSANAFKDTGDYKRLRKMIENEDGDVSGEYIHKYDLLLDKVCSLTNQSK